MTEFFAAATPRAVDINNRFNTEAVGKSEPEREMMKMAAIVETVPRWANDTTVGGDIAQVIFDKTSNGWRWFHRPSFCPEN